MYKTLTRRLKLTKNQTKLLSDLTHYAKNLYNQALYNVRQHYFETKEYLQWRENDKLLQNTENYIMLNSAQAQCIIKKVDEAMKGFFGLLKTMERPGLPRYLDKGGHYPLIDRMVYRPDSKKYSLPRSNTVKKISNFLYDATKKVDSGLLDRLKIDSTIKLEFKLPKYLHDKQIKEVTIKPSFDGKYFTICYVYIADCKIPQNNELTPNYLGIDFGYNNLAYCATSNSHLLIDGRYLKSLNQLYHKKMAYYSAKRVNQEKLTKRMERLIIKRNNQMTYYINKCAKLITDFSVNNQVTDIIIGYNSGFKDINLSKQYNQMANSIPIARLRDRIIYLASLSGIKTEVVNEAYTSKASFIDNDKLSGVEFSGKRIKRGLYCSEKSGIMINADLNAALNIIRKCNPEIKVGPRGLNTPKRVYL